MSEPSPPRSSSADTDPEGGRADAGSAHDVTLTLSGSGRGLADDQPTPAGTTLGKYRLGRCLGRGGMGVVYAGRDTLLQRPVAIKVLSPRLTGDPTARRRFVSEARLAARLNHPHVVTIFDVGRQGQTYFIAMERVAGPGLDQVLQRRGPLPLREAVRIIQQAARALAAAHEAGLIHRDIKPANLMLGRDLSVKVTDFGLAELHHAAPPAPGLPGRETSIDTASAAAGTPRYMSPEQCDGRPLDPRTDLYSLGATFYTLLTGQPPFAGRSVAELMDQHRRAPVPDPAAALSPPPPARLGKIVRRAMAKSPQDRYPDASAMADDLTLLLRELDAQDASPAASTGGTADDSPLDAVFAALGDTSEPSTPSGTEQSDWQIEFPPSSRPPARSAARLRAWLGPALTVAGLTGFALAAGLIFDSSRDPAPASVASAVRGPVGTAVAAPSPAPNASPPRVATPVDTLDDLTLTPNPAIQASPSAAARTDASPTPAAGSTFLRRRAAKLLANRASSTQPAKGEATAVTPPQVVSTAAAMTAPADPGPTAEPPTPPTSTPSAGPADPATPTPSAAAQQFQQLSQDLRTAADQRDRNQMDRVVRQLQVFGRRYQHSTRPEEAQLAHQAYELLEQHRPAEPGPANENRPARRRPARR